MNTFIVKGKSRQEGAIGILEPFELTIKANSSDEAREGAIFIQHSQGRVHVEILSCEYGGYDNTPMYINTGAIHNTDELKRVVASIGSHFFDPESVRFFRSRLAPDVYHCASGVVFITSEQFVSYHPTYRKESRFWTVRILTRTGRIREIGEFQQYASLAQARRGAKEAIESGERFD